MLHAPFSDYTDPLTGMARIITRCGDDLLADHECLSSKWDISKLSEKRRGRLC